MKKLLWLLFGCIGGGALWMMVRATPLPVSEVLLEVRGRVLPTLQSAVKAKELAVGNPIFIRIFKETKELELWLQQSKSKQWLLFKTYPINTWGSGTLGPKLAEGDRQAPEGFYEVGSKQMNPFSSYHLAFNLGYPNAHDQAHGYTGSALMVHGSQASIGCFAMTNPLIEEIYLLAEAALAAGQPKFSVHCFPFRMTPERLALAKDERWLAFWENLRSGYDAFEKTKQVPLIKGDAKGYRVVPGD